MRLKIIIVIGYLVQHFHITTPITDKEYASMPHIFHLDDFDHCWQFDDEFLYCNIEFNLRPQNLSAPTKLWNIISETSAQRYSYRHDIIRHGVCVPKTCPEAKGDPEEDLEEIRLKLEQCYNKKYASVDLQGEIKQIQCESKNDPYPRSGHENVFLVFLGIYIAIVIIATFYEGTARYKPQEEYEKITTTSVGKFLTAFSLCSNWYRLKVVNYDDPNIQALSSIQGVRFYNMILVIATHTLMINLAGPVSNVVFLEKAGEKWVTVFFENGGYAVQTFFMISSWMLMYHFLSRYEDSTAISWKTIFQAFIYRYLRLTPTLAIVMAYELTFLPHRSRGPFWDAFVGEEYRRCRSNGWTNLLYVNNLIKNTDMCMPQTWYLAVDTQLFILGLLIIKYTWKNSRRLVTVAVVLVVLHVCTLFFLIYSNDWDFTVRTTPEQMYKLNILRDESWHQFLGSTYSNIPGLVVGLIYGYIYYKYRNQKLFTKKTHIAAVWIISWGGGLGIILIPGSFIHFSTLYKHDALYDALYGCINRTIFIISVGLGLLGITYGHGWIQKRVCEWKPAYILGRLTYGAYFTHMVFIRMRGGMLRTPTFLTDYILFFEMIGDVTLAFLSAVVLTLLIEMPFANLQNILFARFAKGSRIGSDKKVK